MAENNRKIPKVSGFKFKLIELTHEMVGTLKLGYISVGLMIELSNLKTLSPREFADRFLFSVISQPKHSLDTIKEWPDEIVQFLCVEYLKYHGDLGKHFKQNEDQDFFQAFQACFSSYAQDNLDRMAELGKSLGEQLRINNEEMLKSLNKVFKANEDVLKSLDIAAASFSKAFWSPPILPAYSAFGKLAADIQPAYSAFGRLAADIQRYLPTTVLTRIPVVPSPALKLTAYDVKLQTMSPVKEYVSQEEILSAKDEAIANFLISVNPDLDKKRQGAWDAFRGSSRDKLPQAAHSMREVLRLLIDQLAPDTQVEKASWYKKPKKGDGITRAMKIRYTLSGSLSQRNRNDEGLILGLVDVVNAAYAKLSTEAHTLPTSLPEKVKVVLETCEHIIVLIKTFRH